MSLSQELGQLTGHMIKRAAEIPASGLEAMGLDKPDALSEQLAEAGPAQQFLTQPHRYPKGVNDGNPDEPRRSNNYVDWATVSPDILDRWIDRQDEAEYMGGYRDLNHRPARTSRGVDSPWVLQATLEQYRSDQDRIRSWVGERLKQKYPDSVWRSYARYPHTTGDQYIPEYFNTDPSTSRPLRQRDDDLRVYDWRTSTGPGPYPPQDYRPMSGAPTDVKSPFAYPGYQQP